ncbi:hypothetical protein DNTS_011868 [Danionella cerebrum]|uniref:Ankyrin repeat domain-containing protein 27 n=1 Tax=Danionella cerebrum TaxID=2873325 RepID=A0A553Q7C3_9TELE|nr:hypothetical protein DNTS_011868 [Danionella translucida]
MVDSSEEPHPVSLTPPQSAGASPHASDSSSRRSSVSSASSLRVEAAPPDPSQHREVEKLLRAVADGDMEMVRYLLDWLDEEPEEEESGLPEQTDLCHPLCQCARCEPTQKISWSPRRRLRMLALCLCVFRDQLVSTATPSDASAVSVCLEISWSPRRRPRMLALCLCVFRDQLVSTATPSDASAVSVCVQRSAGLHGDALGVNSSSADGFTALHVAALHGSTALVSLFIRRGANVNAGNKQSATPLHLACQNCHAQVVCALLESNAKLNKKDQHGNTPLIHACLKGSLEIASQLLESGALVNLANHQGNTALHEAVRGSHLTLVELLLRRGASVQIRNRRQRTALDCAQDTAGKVSPSLLDPSEKVWNTFSCVFCSTELRDPAAPAESQLRISRRPSAQTRGHHGREGGTPGEPRRNRPGAPAQSADVSRGRVNLSREKPSAPAAGAEERARGDSRPRSSSRSSCVAVKSDFFEETGG